MAEYDEKNDNYRANDGSIHYSLGDADAHDKGIVNDGYGGMNSGNVAESWGKMMNDMAQEKRHEEWARQDRREEREMKINKLRSNYMGEFVLHNLPRGREYFQQGNYATALPLLEQGLYFFTSTGDEKIIDEYIRVREYTIGNCDIPAVIKFVGPRETWQEQALTLRQQVAECYVKRAERYAEKGNYSEALDNYFIAHAYQHEDRDGILKRIDEIIEKLAEKALEGNDNALRAIMLACSLTIVTTLTKDMASDGKFERKVVLRFYKLDLKRPVEVCMQLLKQGRPEAAYQLAEYYETETNTIGLTRSQRNIEYRRIQRRKQLYKKAIALEHEDKKSIRWLMRDMIKDYRKRPRKFFAFINFLVTIGVTLGAFMLGMICFGEDSTTALIIAGVSFFVSFALFFEVWIRRVWVGIALVLLLSVAGYIYVIIPAFNEMKTIENMLENDEGSFEGLTATVKQDGVKFFAKPGAVHPIKTLQKGDVLTVTGAKTGSYNLYLPVIFNGTKGYVEAAKVSLVRK